MAKNKVEIDVKVDDKGTTKKVGLGAKKAGDSIDGATRASDKYAKKQKGVAQAGMNSTKAFSKMTEGSNGLVAAYASLAAQLFAISAAFQFLKQAGQLKSLQEGQQAYASATGIAMKSLTNDIIAATEAQVTFTDASQAAAIGVASGLNPDQLTELGTAAKNASLILGRDVTDSFNRLVRGVTKAEPELLDELGIILRLDTATENYARSIGKTKDELSAFERSQAVANDVLTQAEEKYGRILEITGASVNKFAQLGKAFDDIINNLKELAVTIGTPLANVLIEYPKMALGAVLLLFKPVVTSILPGLGNVVEATKRVADASKESFKVASKEVEKYEKALNAKKPIDASGARAGVANLLAGQKGSKRSILEQAKAGKQLNNRQIKQLEATIKKKKLLRGKELRDFQAHLEKMKQANSAANRKMEADFALSQKKKTASLKKFEAAAKGIFSRVASAGAVMARGLSMAFSALGWVALIGTLAMTAYEMFKTKDATKETEEEFDHLGKKLREVNEELKHFNQIQNILNEDGDNTIATIGNIGRAFGNISSGMFTKAAGQYDSALKRFNKRNNIESLEQSAAEGDINAQLDLIGIGSSRGKSVREDIFTAGGGKEGKGADFLELIHREASAILFNTDAKIRGSEAGMRYVRAVRAVQQGTAESSEEIIAARNAYKNFALEIGSLTRTQIENAKAGKDIRAQYLPETKYEKYINGLKQEIALQQKLADDSESARPEAEAEINRLNTEVQLMERLNAQLKEQARQKALLNVQKQEELAANPFRLFDKGTNRAFNLREAEMRDKHLRAQLKTTTDIALEKDGITAAEKDQIENIKLQIRLNKIKLGQAREEMGEMYDIKESFLGGLESGLTTAFTDIISGTKSVKDAFKDMAMSILQAMSKVVAEMIAVYMLKQLISGFMGPDFAPGYESAIGRQDFSNVARYGGVFSNGKEMTGYSAGGIASGPQAGYPALLHGTEAVVPLPNGKSIPVDMKGAGQVNNVTVNVHVDKDGNATEQKIDSNEMESASMGRAIAKAVQKELQNQQRSGGTLSPYGAA